MNPFNFRGKAITVIFFLSFLTWNEPLFAQSDLWQAGVARVDITPTDSLWLAGYAVRDHSVEGTLHKLWAKALAVKDENGKIGVLITTDLLGLPKSISDNIRTQCKKKYNLERSQIILSSSHTHSGPVLRESLYNVYPLTSDQIEKINSYSDQLEKQIIDLIGQVLENMIPSELFSNNGVVRFQVNRRNNDASELTEQTQLNGPNDYAVPVLEVRKTNGDLFATAFGYACHPTVLDSYQWSGDYPGFSQLLLEEKYPDITALFFQGCGADQNPLPRRSVSLAKQYGQELAIAVERVIEDESEPIQSVLITGYSEVELYFSSPPSKETLERISKDTTIVYYQKWAIKMLRKMKESQPIPTSYPYPVQIWKLGNQTIIALGGEVVIDYAIELKRIFGNDIFVMSYCNDVMGYIPSLRVLREGGYEGATSQIVYDLPGTWKADTEVRIINEVINLAQEIGVEIPKSKLFQK